MRCFEQQAGKNALFVLRKQTFEFILYKTCAETLISVYSECFKCIIIHLLIY